MVDHFISEVRKAGPSSIALIFFAGHGVQLDGVNYIALPKTRIASPEDVAKNAISIPNLLERLRAVGNHSTVVMIDACRNNPFLPQNARYGRGLAPMNAKSFMPDLAAEGLAKEMVVPPGVGLFYSTAPGEFALDALEGGRHSPYAAAFAELLDEPKISFLDLVNRLGSKTIELTKGQQVPWVSYDLFQDFTLWDSSEVRSR